ncbi:MAG TPA: tetratricopeptide repeat protein [Roseiflexaceae bacterium]|nr:tetratricopeptide repeat protein [Roseiflexaceae bacterium]
MREAGYAIADTNGYAWLRSMMLVVRGVLEALRSKPETARQPLHRALLAARAVGDPRHITLTLSYLGLVALGLGQYDEAERICRESLAIAQEHQDRYQMSQSLQSLGRVAVARGAHAKGEALLHDGLAIAREMGDRWLEAEALGSLAQLAAVTRDEASARAQQWAAVRSAAAAPSADCTGPTRRTGRDRARGAAGCRPRSAGLCVAAPPQLPCHARAR